MITHSLSCSSDYELYQNHLCSSPMKKPKASELETQRDDQRKWQKIDNEFVKRLIQNMCRSDEIYCNLGNNLLRISPEKEINCNDDKSTIKLTKFTSNILDNMHDTNQNQSILMLGINSSGKSVKCYFYVFVVSCCFLTEKLANSINNSMNKQ